MKNTNQKLKNEFKKRLYTWVLHLIAMIEKLPRGITSETLGKQLLRSGTSILANYVEAGSASSKRDYINFFNHALKSANESKVWLSLLRDTKKVHMSDIEKLLHELSEIANILAASVLTMRGKR